jgi:hypothetical protein
MSIVRVIGVTVCAALLIAGGWFANSRFSGDFRTYQLADGRSILALRHLDEVYPLYGKTFKAEMDLALDQRKQLIDTSAGGKYEQGVRQLYQNLDLINADVRTALVSAYSVLITRLSAGIDATQQEEAFRKWDEVLASVIKETARLREINLQLAAAKKLTSSGEWEQLTNLGETAKEGAEAIKAMVRP